MNKLKKFLKGTGTKIFAIFTAVFLLIPTLCAFTYPLTVSFTNPDNLPFENLDAYFNSTDLQLGSTAVDTPSTIGLSQFYSSGTVSSELVLPDGYCVGATVRPPDYQDEIFYGTTFIMNNAEALVNKKITGTGVLTYSITSEEILAIYPDAEPISYGIGIPRFGLFYIVFYADGDSVDFKLSSDQTLYENMYDVFGAVGPLFGSEPLPTYDEFLSEMGPGVQVMYIYVDIQDIPSPTASIKDVWTGILDWITGALSSIQGLFITKGNDPDPTHLKAGTYTFNDVLNTDIVFDQSINFYYDDTVDGMNIRTNYSSLKIENGPLVGYQTTLIVDGITMDNYSDKVIYSIDDGFGGRPQEHTIFVDTEVDETFGSWYLANTNYNEVNAQYSLTLIGTLTVIGLAIGIAFLIIGIIQRFLKLRG